MTTPSEPLSTSPDVDLYGAQSEDSGSGDGAKATARREASHVKDSAMSEAHDVAQTTKEQAQAVASDVREQAQTLLDESRSQLADQAGTQRDRAVESLRSLAGELDDMASQSAHSGLGAQLAREGGQRAHQVADFLDGREPGQLLDELRELGRRRPGAFLAGAAVAGVVVGRISRGAMGARKSDSASTADVTPTAGTPIYDQVGGRGSSGGSPSTTDTAPIAAVRDLASSSEVTRGRSQGGYQ